MADIDAIVYKDETGAVVIEADGQQIEVCEQSARFLAMRLCNLFDYRIKYEGVKIGLLRKGNENSTKEKPLG